MVGCGVKFCRMTMLMEFGVDVLSDRHRPGPGGVRAVHWHRALEAKGPNPRYVHTISYSWYT